MKADVIVTYCWNRVGYNIIKSLHKKGLKVVVGDTSKWNICSLSRFCDDSFVYADPFTNEKQFLSDLTEAIKKYRPKVVIPTHDESLIIARNKEKLPKDVIIATEDYDKLNMLSNKYEATKLALSLGIPCPSFVEDYKKHSFPIVIKTKFGNSAKGVFIPKTPVEAERVFRDLAKEDYFIEEYFKGNDYSVDCLRYNDFFYATCYKALVTKTDGGGTTTQRVIVNNKELIAYTKLLVDQTNYQGVCGIDYKVNEETGAIAFIEVNTRYTGGLATPIAAGFDIPYIHYCLVTDGKYEQPISVKTGTKTKWILGDIIALVTKLSQRTLKKNELKQILKWRFDGYDDFSNDDKKAILGEMAYYFNKLVKNRKLNP